VVGRQNADIGDTLHLRDVAMATTFGVLFQHRTMSEIKNVLAAKTFLFHFRRGSMLK